MGELLFFRSDSTLSRGAKIGNYRFVQKEDGTYAILLKFNQDYLNSKPQIKGDIDFYGEIGTEYGKQDGTIEITFNDNITLNVPENDITYPADKTNVWISKRPRAAAMTLRRISDLYGHGRFEKKARRAWLNIRTSSRV